ncbi:MAG TPA: DinB family protein [Gemmatimonadaceae bacterium]|nr:DinB family protein [Gemmatimonadaceae bacterium]
MREHFQRLYAHLAWADTRVLQGLRTAQSVLKSIMDLYCHILGSEHVWLSRVKGEDARYAVWPTLTLDEAQTLSAENITAYEKLLAGTDAAAFARMITYRNSAGEQFTSSLEDILTHVAMHGSYHRAQVAMLMRQSGETPTPTDYIAFARGSPAATRK